MNLVTLHKSNFRDPVATLRVLADEIEAGNYGEVGCVAVVVMGDELSVLGMGADSEAPSVALVLNAGALYLTRGLLEHGRE